MDQETANLRMLGMRRMLGMGGFLSARFLIVVVLHLRRTVTDEGALLLAKSPWESSRRSKINRDKLTNSVAFSRRV